MDTKEIMIGLSDSKIYAVDLKDNGKIEETNRRLYLLKRQEIERAKAYMSGDNAYKKYLIENLNYIKLRLSLDTTVETTEEAIKLLQEKVDMRVMFGIDSQYAEIFESQVFLKEEYYEGIEDTREEAECSMSKIINSKDGFISIDYSVQEHVALGMYMYRLSVYTSKLKGYISFNTKTKKQLYFLKFNEDTNDNSYNIYLDIIELYEICLCCNNQYASIKEICRLLNIKIDYEVNQIKKYENNLKILSVDSVMESKYPMLSDCLKYHGDFLKFINIYGMEQIDYSSRSYLCENIFTFANDFIGVKAVNSEEIDKKLKFGKGTINPKLNLFCILGLLKKISYEELQDKYRHRAIGYKKEENSYIITPYTEEVLNEAEKRITMIKNAKVNATKLTGATCRAIFGEELFNSVYGNYYKVGA